MLFKKKRKIIIEHNLLVEFSILLLGSTIYALTFNLFFLPNDIVVGFSGLSVIALRLWNIKPSLFLFIGYIFIILFSLMTLGWKSTKKSLIGSLLYPILVEATSYIVPFIDLSNIEYVVLIVCGALFGGFGSGILYKIGYSTGGSDIINQILSKIMQRPIGTTMMISNGIIIALGFLVFGLPTVIYSLLVVFVMSFVVDKVMIGISESKNFNIITTEEREVNKYLTNKLKHGVTVIHASGGYSGKDVKVIMCVIPTREYITVKENILAIDSNALILVSDVYQVLGNK